MSLGLISLQRGRSAAAALLACVLVAGCATHPSPQTPQADAAYWSGRLSLTVASEPPQTFAASFALSGSADEGELVLNSPLGSALAVMQWQPGLAVLHQGGQTRQYPSLDSLAAEVTGAELPVRALFSWLRGQPQTVPGWQPDFSRHAEGRLSAHRAMPLPTAELRVVLER